MLDNYDPDSIKLFSKCARNQASRFSQNKKSTPVHRPHSSIMVYHQNMKKRKTISTFDMSESRDQREKKYRPIMTPAVGQYNPKVEKKIKLTWDILKVFNKRSHRRPINQKSKQNQLIHSKSKIEQPNNQLVQNVVMTEISEPINVDHYKESQAIATLSQADIKTSGAKRGNKYISTRRRSQNKRYKTIRSQVDMSRMTGRANSRDLITLGDEEHNYEQSQQVDINKSIQFVKSKTSQNLLFQRQLSRQKVNSLNKPINVPSDYSYDYNILKPKQSQAVAFGKSVGRDHGSINSNPSAYGYTHYDYDKYVWGAKSNVYSNTKTHVIEFKKQTKRVLFKRY